MEMVEMLVEDHEGVGLETRVLNVDVGRMMEEGQVALLGERSGTATHATLIQHESGVVGIEGDDLPCWSSDNSSVQG
ncbi:hypothetical protein CALVIDRAFT_540369 [Calocera viscosa TUFC12733]|uniref:Uncharacterized protein n=1 Tax=Calocera viscosa (strain TUFC12733) TaxID=1330018 RepID=A0A167J016_CALVF|nr:hypothetical protein CALVIDRAFT_540369 [Calocera viscosa TUFC12733]